MGKGTRRNKSKPKQIRRRVLPAVPTTTTVVDDLPDELLFLVLLGLGSPLDLIRAAATCARWRRAIAAEGFLGRFYALHGAPCVAGHYYVTYTQARDITGVLGWQPRKPAATFFVPSSPAAVVDGGGLFSLDFLYAPPVTDRPPCTYSWGPRRTRIRHNQCREVVDSRGSLLLVTNGPWQESVHPRRRGSPDFIVCEPVSRRYQGIARPADLSHLPFLGAFLLDGDGGGDTMSNFRVLSVLYEPDMSRYPFGTPRVCVFAPGSDGGWHIYWHTAMDNQDVEVPLMETIHLAGRTSGKVYWGIEDGTVLVLDEIMLKFSILMFPAQMRGPYGRTSFRVIGSGVDDGEDRVRVVRVDGEGLKVFGQLPDSGEWVVEKRVGLRDATAVLSGWEDYRFFRQPARIVTAGDTFVVLTPAEKMWLFSVELETLEVENEHVRNRNIGPSFPCALPWPPLLRACVRRSDDVVGNKRGQRRSKG